MQVCGAVGCVGAPMQEQDAGRLLARPAQDQGCVKGYIPLALWRWLRLQLQRNSSRLMEDDIAQPLAAESGMPYRTDYDSSIGPDGARMHMQTARFEVRMVKRWTAD